MKSGRSIFKRSKAPGSDLPDGGDSSKVLGKHDERLLFAAEKGDVANVKAALKKGASLYKRTREGASAIHLACQHGHMQLVEYMKQLESECVELRDDQDRNPAHYACKSGHLLCTKLIRQGRQNNQLLCHPDSKGQTPLHYAAYGGHVSVVEYLCSEGCPVSSANGSGVTPLIFACMNEHLPVVQELLKHSCDVNCVDKDSRSALLYASEKGLRDIVDALLRRGARPDLADRDNKTALDYAVERQHHEIEECLRRAPKVASYDLGVPPGVKSRAVRNEQSDELVRTFSGSSLVSETQERPRELASRLSTVSATSGKLMVANKSKSELASEREDSLQQEIKALKEDNDCLEDDVKRLTEDKRRLEIEVGNLQEEVKNSQQSSEPDELLQDLNMKLNLQQRELHRGKEKLRKAEEEVVTLRAQLESYQAEEDEKGDLDFADDNDDDMLPGMGPSQKAPPGLLQAQEMITQLRRQITALRVEKEDTSRAAAAASDNRESEMVRTLKAQVKNLQAENAQLADRLDESDDGSPPSVPLAVYQELQETEAQKIKELERQLTAMQQQHQTQARTGRSDGKLDAQLSAMTSKLAVQEEEHNHTVHLYRQYILAAAQGRLRPEMHQLLSQIAEARQVEGE